MAIGARSQSAKTYLEKHYEDFPECKPSQVVSALWYQGADDRMYAPPASPGDLEALIKHGMHALRETLQQDKELNTLNTSIVSSLHKQYILPLGMLISATGYCRSRFDLRYPLFLSDDTERSETHEL